MQTQVGITKSALKPLSNNSTNMSRRSNPKKKEQVLLHAHRCIPNGNNLKELALASNLDKTTALVSGFKKLLERNPEKAMKDLRKSRRNVKQSSPPQVCCILKSLNSSSNSTNQETLLSSQLRTTIVSGLKSYVMKLVSLDHI